MDITVLGLCGQSVFLGTDHFHTPGETVHAETLHMELGGKGFNQAVAAARLGAQVSFITCVGDDQAGRDCLRFLEGEGILPVAQVSPEAATAYACILTDKAGENRVTVYRGASGLLSPEFIRQNEAVIAGSGLLLLNHEYPAGCNLAALELAEKHGVPVILNPAPAKRMDASLLERFSLVTPNFSEAAVMLGGLRNVEDLPGLFQSHGIRRAVVTLGGGGALVIDGGKMWKVPAKPSTVKDTTGAGDTFTAALAVALLRKKTLLQAVEYAGNAAALSVSQNYVLPGLPTESELKSKFTALPSTEISGKGMYDGLLKRIFAEGDGTAQPD